jgi:invasion protein IalB
MPEHNKGREASCRGGKARFNKSNRKPQGRCGVMLLGSKFALAACGLSLSVAGGALAQSGEAGPGAAVPRPNTPDAPKTAKAAAETPKPPGVTIAGNFGQWALICGKDKDKDGKEPCSLVQALVQRETQKLVFRLTVAYGPKGNLVLRVDGPTGVALQKGLEFSPDAVKIYRLPFQACIAQGCSALLVMPDDLRQELGKSEKGTITVYALSGQAVQAVAELTGFADGLAALDKRLGKP